MPPTPALPLRGRGKTVVIGLTGGIGMGKSTLASQLARLGAKICNADAIVHGLLAEGGRAVGEVKKHFPGVVKNGVVDRKALGDAVFGDAKKLKQLETLLHPLVVAEENNFVRNLRRHGARIAVLDIPLLYETGAEKRCDLIIVASAPAFLQRQRVIKRTHMREEKFRHILSLQMPDRDKRKHADAVILTGLGKAHSFRQLVLILRDAKRLRRIQNNRRGILCSASGAHRI